jgi:DNA-binding transcriptional ArsR family regulator
VLKAAGLVDCSRLKNQMLYRIADERVFELCTLVCDGVYRQLKAQAVLLNSMPVTNQGVA